MTKYTPTGIKPKYKHCPNCHEHGTPDQDNWVHGGKLQQHCTNCRWTGLPRTPETLPPQNKRTYHDLLGSDWHYEIHDKYNRTYISSRAHPTKKTATKALKQELTHLNRPDNTNTRAPYTATLYPPTVIVTGKIFK